MFAEIIKDSKTVPQTIVYKLNKGLATLAEQDEALKSPYTAYLFAKRVPGADIEKCQEAACKKPKSAFHFAKNVKGADIEKCQEAVCKDPELAYWFACFVPGANIEKCRKACEGTMYAF